VASLPSQHLISSATNESILHYAARHNNMEITAKGCHIRHFIDLDQRSTDELRTALHIAVQQSNVGIRRLLLENGAKDEWKDFLGMHARHNVRDDAIGVLFLQRKMLEDQPNTHPRSSLYDNYQQNTQESTKRNQAPSTASTSNTVVFPSKEGKFSSTTKKKGEAETSSANESPYNEQQPIITPENIPSRCYLNY
jgi:ankyrin repeat protein